MELDTKNYWICVTNPYNWTIIKDRNLWRTDDRYEKTMRRISVGDKFVIYTTGMNRWKINYKNVYFSP